MNALFLNWFCRSWNTGCYWRLCLILSLMLSRTHFYPLISRTLVQSRLKFLL